MNDPWNKVYTILKNEVGDKCYSGTSSMATPSSFPYMSVVQITNNVTADDLENDENAINSAFEVKVYSDKNQTEARNIMKIVCDKMQSMGFRRSGPYSPSNVTDTNIYRVIYRFSRIIGSEEDY